MRSALYAGRVTHARLRPKRHKLSYRVFSLLLDLDELETLSRGLKFFGHNRAAIFSFHDKDHGTGGPDLRGWVLAQLGTVGAALAAPRIEVLCYPRILGYVFNPLTVYFCLDGKELRAILYEVHNTFGERRTYVVRVDGRATGVEQRCAKELYVSPFVPMDCTYNFRIEPPEASVLIAIAERDADGLLLSASFWGKRQELTDRSLLGAFLRYPLMTFKVTAAIHWEALRLWLKGVRYIARKPAPRWTAP
jgi:DUF1365 family protein